MRNKKKNHSDKKIDSDKKIVLDSEQITQVEKLASCGLNTRHIAGFLGFSRDTFYEIRKRQPEVLRHYNKGKSMSVLFSSNALAQRIREGDTTANIFHLKSKAAWSAKKAERLKLNVPDKATPMDIIDEVISQIRKGNITLSEVKQLTSLAQTKHQMLANPLPEPEQKFLSEEFIEKNMDFYLDMKKTMDKYIEIIEAENANQK